MTDRSKKKIASLKKLLAASSREINLLQRITRLISTHLDLDLILKEIVELVVSETRADACLIYLLDESCDELILRASKKPHPTLIGRVRLEVGEGITGWVAKERTVVAISKDAHNDPRFKQFHRLPEDRYQAFLSIPVINRSEVVGVINIQHKKSHNHSEGEVALLTMIGQQVGGAILNARLYEETSKKAMQVDTLTRMSGTITSNRYIEEILNLIVTMTAQMMNSKICSIMILDSLKGELQIVATQSLSETYRKKPNLKVGESISGRVVKEQRPITVRNVAEDSNYSFPKIAREEGICSLLSVPMMVKNRVIGVINSYTAVEHTFSQEEIHLLSAVANQAAVAIENTTLFEKSGKMQEALSAQKAIDRAKGFLMQQGKIGEEEAFKIIQRQSMNTRKTMREVAEAIVLASGRFPPLQGEGDAQNP
ncbi:MAG: GAF domain-containing protein [Nitrospirae bacterium]|nr:GAF domain-containing protein [Candidatus Troglogloeales bacterium]